jgi:hypothetical protein
MTKGSRTDLIVLILAVIGGLAVIGVLGMWLMQGTMGGMMGGGMMGGGLIGLLILGALIALVVLLARRRT